jgi:hypothetical protein
MSAYNLIHLSNNPDTPQQPFFINTAQMSYRLLLLMLLLLFQSAFKELLAMLVNVQTILTQLHSSVTLLY